MHDNNPYQSTSVSGSDIPDQTAHFSGTGAFLGAVCGAIVGFSIAWAVVPLLSEFGFADDLCTIVRIGCVTSMSFLCLLYTSPSPRD